MELVTKIQNKNYQLDFTNNRITFLDSRLYWSEGGSYYPSSTTILDSYPKGFGYYEWLKRVGEDADEIRDDAGRRGSKVHSLTEKYDNGEEVSLINENGEIAMRMSEWGMFEKYVAFRKKFEVSIDEIELNLVSDKLQFGGTLDRIITLNDHRILIDIKTSNAIYNHYWLQVTSYAKLYEEITGSQVDGVGILWLNAKTRSEGKTGSFQGHGWQLLVKTDQKEIDHYWSLFISTQRLWMEENSGFMPRQTEYKLKHKL